MRWRTARLPGPADAIEGGVVDLHHRLEGRMEVGEPVAGVDGLRRRDVQRGAGVGVVGEVAGGMSVLRPSLPPFWKMKISFDRMGMSAASSRRWKRPGANRLMPRAPQARALALRNWRR
jgi:hypothetical protein